MCSTVDAILDKACIDNMQLFFDLFNPLIGFLSSPENPSQGKILKMASNLLRQCANMLWPTFV